MVTSQATRESGMAVLWRELMSPALRPELALAYLRELSPGVTGCALVDTHGTVLAGDHHVVASSGAGDHVVASDPQGCLIAATGVGAPRTLVELDVRLAMAAVRGHC
jgi:hypothetical protein